MGKGIEIDSKIKKRRAVKQQHRHHQGDPGPGAEFKNKLSQVIQTKKKVKQGKVLSIKKGEDFSPPLGTDFGYRTTPPSHLI